MYKVKEIIGDILLTMFLEGQFNAFMLEHVAYNAKKKLGVIIEQEGNKYCRLELEEDMEFHIAELRKIIGDGYGERAGGKEQWIALN